MRYIAIILVVCVVASCSSSSDGSGGGSDSGTASDTTDATNAGDGTDGTDGTDSSSTGSDTIVETSCGAYDTSTPASSSNNDIVFWNFNPELEECTAQFYSQIGFESLPYGEAQDIDLRQDLYFGSTDVTVVCDADVVAHELCLSLIHI